MRRSYTTVTVSEQGLIVPDSGKLALPEYAKPQPGNHPPLDSPGYKSTALRHPKQPLVLLPQRLTEVTGPLLGDDLITMQDADLTTQHAGAPQGHRIFVCAQVRDSGGRPVPDTLIEIWQTNAAGRYRHTREHHPAPLDPNFGGTGRAITDSGGRYRFITIQPGSYPWGNHPTPRLPPHVGGPRRAIPLPGRRYRFITIQPGSSPWGNPPNAWRPAPIHYSLFG